MLSRLYVHCPSMVFPEERFVVWAVNNIPTRTHVQNGHPGFTSPLGGYIRFVLCVGARRVDSRILAPYRYVSTVCVSATSVAVVAPCPAKILKLPAAEGGWEEARDLPNRNAYPLASLLGQVTAARDDVRTSPTRGQNASPIRGRGLLMPNGYTLQSARYTFRGVRYTYCTWDFSCC